MLSQDPTTIQCCENSGVHTTEAPVEAAVEAVVAVATEVEQARPVACRHQYMPTPLPMATATASIIAARINNTVRRIVWVYMY